MNRFLAPLLFTGLFALGVQASAQVYGGDPYRDNYRGGYGSYGRYEQGPGSLLQRVDVDLERAARSNYYGTPRERTRFENARRHLWEFQERLNRGHFDHGKLSTTINDIQNIIEHNGMPPRERESLYADLARLREMRREQEYRYGYGYRY